MGPGLGLSSDASGLARLPWSVAAYSLTVGSFILITGRLGDVYGHKRLFALGFVWYAFWSLLLGFANYTSSAFYFDVMRAMQGIGSATVCPTASSCSSACTPTG